MAAPLSFSATSSDLLEVMKTMKLDQSLISFIKERKDEWGMFGKKNSHLYREQLMNMMRDAGLSAEAKLMVYFFFSVIKNQPRVLKELNNMSADVKAEAWYNPTKDFIASHVTQYVTSTVGNNKMPAVNIPSCNPGLDILVFSLITNPADQTIEKVRTRTTFTQLDLDSGAQAEAKKGYAEYWDNIVKGTKNETKTEAPKMREDYYNTIAGDRYKLLDINLKEIDAPSGGYTKDFVLKYFKDIQESTKDKMSGKKKKVEESSEVKK